MKTLLEIDGTLLTVTKGRDVSFVATIARADLELDEGALTGAVFCIKDNLNAADADAPVRLTLNSGITRLVDADAETIQFRIDLPRAALLGLSPAGRYSWDFALQDADGKLHDVQGLGGPVAVRPRVAHSAT